MKREELLHFNWKYNYLIYNGLFIESGEKLEILDIGIHNQDSGPDFFNAKVKIGNTVWAGNVEIHLNSSDWYNHGHNNDQTYDNVILHVVTKNDRPAINSKGVGINTLIIPFPDNLEWSLLKLLGTGKWIPCAEKIKSIDPFSKNNWIDRLLIERLEQKNQSVFESVTQLNGNWEEAFYQSVSRSFGLVINTLPFEMLAKATPMKIFAKQKDNLLQIEAVLFGQAGMLSEIDADEQYILNLKREYKFLKSKYNLKPIDSNLWKFMRMRPSSFPTVRIAQLAGLIFKSTSLFSKIVETKNSTQILKYFDVKASEFWDTHFTFKKNSQKKVKHLGKETIERITLNAIVPFMFSYGTYISSDELKEKAIKLLETIKSEKNKITHGFEKLGFTVKTASDSQALIQLKTNYCDQKKCLYCRFGAKFLLS